MPYADLPTVYHLLDLDAVDPDDEAARDRVDQLNSEMSRLVELKTGRAWGSPAAPPQARVVEAPYGFGAVAGSWSWGQQTVLPLPTPLRSATAVVITGDAAETLQAADYVLTQRTQRGDAHALRRIDGLVWPARDGRSVITVTGIWSDMADGTAAPVEIVEAVNFLVVEQYRLEQTNPAGAVDQEGRVFRARNPWKFEVVAEAIRRHRALPVPGF